MSACAYCHARRGVHREHVVPKAVRKTHRAQYDALPDELKATVSACFACNLLKGQRRLVPPSWADKVSLLQDLLPGTEWRVWSGGVSELAYRGVHV